MSHTTWPELASCRANCQLELRLITLEYNGQPLRNVMIRTYCLSLMWVGTWQTTLGDLSLSRLLIAVAQKCKSAVLQHKSKKAFAWFKGCSLSLDCISSEYSTSMMSELALCKPTQIIEHCFLRLLLHCLVLFTSIRGWQYYVVCLSIEVVQIWLIWWNHQYLRQYSCYYYWVCSNDVWFDSKQGLPHPRRDK